MGGSLTGGGIHINLCSQQRLHTSRKIISFKCGIDIVQM